MKRHTILVAAGMILNMTALVEQTLANPSAEPVRVDVRRNSTPRSQPPSPQPADSFFATLLSAPTLDPLRQDMTNDPVLTLANPAPKSDFQSVVVAAVERNPAIDEAVAQVDEARGARNEASARRLPTLDLALSHYEIVARAFSNDSQNIIERSRPRRRTDAVANLQQPIFDFGANINRLRAAEDRLTAAQHATDDVQIRVALRAVGSWYNVFGYRALVSLTTAFLASQRDLRSELDRRIAQGYSAPADLVQVDSYVAGTAAQLAEYRRRLATAEAQFAELTGTPSPLVLGRAPPPPDQYRTAEDAQADAERTPMVLAAQALARSARSEAKASRADELPKVTAGADIGRYGVFENERDYDARVSGTVSWRLFGGARQRTQQAEARERGAQARSERIAKEARRDAAIAFTDLAGLQAGEQAMREGYIAARRSRDVTAERFRVSRGTLFDLVAADNAYYSAAARYILALTELDTARYALLARTGRLSDALRLPNGVVK